MFMAPIMVYKEFHRPSYLRKLRSRDLLSTFELSNKVVLYQSPHFTPQRNRSLNPSNPDRQHVINALWNFFVMHNPVFQAYLRNHANIPPTLNQQELPYELEHQQLDQVIDDTQQEPVTYFVPAEEVGPIEASPWLDIVDLVLGVDIANAEEIKFDDPKLLALLFPWLFPFGVGYFCLKMSRTKLRGDNEHE
ncbi:hypothetical protein FBU30_001477 [Linnemannia zychae]|nr:hypothetical protein FBU30_001477 [Linnemannia zychae]